MTTPYIGIVPTGGAVTLQDSPTPSASQLGTGLLVQSGPVQAELPGFVVAPGSVWSFDGVD